MKSAMPSIPHAATDEPFHTGALVMFEHDGSALTGMVLGFKKGSYQVLSMRGREIELRANRLQALHGEMPGEHKNGNERASFLLSLFERALKQSAELNLEELWSLVREEGDTFTTEKLAALSFKSPSFEQFTALRLALINDRIYFKRVSNDFSPRPADIVEELKRNEAALARKLKVQELSLEVFLKRLKSPAIPIPPEVEPLLSALEEIAAGVTDIEHGKLKDAKDFMNLFCENSKLELTTAKEKRALLILRAIHHFDQNVNLAIIRHKIPARFSKNIEENAAKVVIPTSLSECSADGKGIREDLTRLRCLTIDDASTRDMDDALSVEQTQDGYTLGVHISDVASVIPHDSPLDAEARRRATSLYLAGHTINMLPEELSEKKCSLLAGEVRQAVSCIIEINRDFSIKSSRIAPTLIRVAKRLSYVEATAALEAEEHDLSILHNIAAANEQKRLEDGAAKLSKKEVLIFPQPRAQFLVQEIDEDDPARALVSELMVLSNSILADTAARFKIPLSFRSQEAPEEALPPQRKLPPTGPAYDFFLRSRLKKSVVGLTPLPHASLGLRAYVQATSPIRRYMDLVNQRQFLWYFTRGKPLYTRGELEKIIDEVEPRLSNAMLVNKETRRYWLLRYLEELQKKNERIFATVVRLDGRTPLVELEKLYATLFARLKPEASLGSQVELRIASIDPDQDIIKLEQI